MCATLPTVPRELHPPFAGTRQSLCAWCPVCVLHPNGVVATASEGIAVQAAELHADSTGHSVWVCVGGKHSDPLRWLGPSLPGLNQKRLNGGH